MHFRSNDMSSVEDQSRGTALSPTVSLSLSPLAHFPSLSLSSASRSPRRGYSSGLIDSPIVHRQLKLCQAPDCYFCLCVWGSRCCTSGGGGLISIKSALRMGDNHFCLSLTRISTRISFDFRFGFGIGFVSSHLVASCLVELSPKSIGKGVYRLVSCLTFPPGFHCAH